MFSSNHGQNISLSTFLSYACWIIIGVCGVSLLFTIAFTIEALVFHKVKLVLHLLIFIVIQGYIIHVVEHILLSKLYYEKNGLLIVSKDTIKRNGSPASVVKLLGFIPVLTFVPHYKIPEIIAFSIRHSVGPAAITLRVSYKLHGKDAQFLKRYRLAEDVEIYLKDCTRKVFFSFLSVHRSAEERRISLIISTLHEIANNHQGLSIESVRVTESKDWPQ